MPKPYNLRIYSSPLDPAGSKFQMDLTRFNTGWRRSIRAQGGYWLGSFRLSGQSEQQLQQWFETWLGYDVRETSGGAVSWKGMIYEMDLTTNGVRRRRSLDLMANAVKTSFTKEEYSGDNMVGNHSLELAGTGGADLFAGWRESDPPGTGGALAATNVPAEVYDGTWAVKLTGDSDGADAYNTYIRQNINITPGNSYKVTYWTRGDGGHHSGRAGINDPNIGGGGGASWVVRPHPTGVTGTTYVQREMKFVGPSEGDVQLFFMAPADLGSVAYFDKIEMYEYLPGVYETDWLTADPVTNASPIGKYGRKEEIIPLDEYNETTSTEYRDTYWAQNAWPYGRPVGAQPPGEAILDVQCAGYIFTVNWMHVTQGDGQAHNVSDWIRSIVGNLTGLSPEHGGVVEGAGDCQFVYAQRIDENTLQVVETVPMDERPFDRIMELVSLGDDAGNPWQFQVLNAFQATYKQISATPTHYLRRDGIFDTAGGSKQSNFWLMKPGVVRDMTYRSGSEEPGSWLENRMDFFVEEIEMADGWSRPALKTALLDESEMLKAQMEMSLIAPEEPKPPFNPGYRIVP